MGPVPLLAIQGLRPEARGPDHTRSGQVTAHWARPHLVMGACEPQRSPLTPTVIPPDGEGSLQAGTASSCENSSGGGQPVGSGRSHLT